MFVECYLTGIKKEGVLSYEMLQELCKLPKDYVEGKLGTSDISLIILNNEPAAIAKVVKDYKNRIESGCICKLKDTFTTLICVEGNSQGNPRLCNCISLDGTIYTGVHKEVLEVIGNTDAITNALHNVKEMLASKAKNDSVE